MFPTIKDEILGNDVIEMGKKIKKIRVFDEEPRELCHDMVKAKQKRQIKSLKGKFEKIMYPNEVANLGLRDFFKFAYFGERTYLLPSPYDVITNIERTWNRHQSRKRGKLYGFDTLTNPKVRAETCT